MTFDTITEVMPKMKKRTLKRLSKWSSNLIQLKEMILKLQRLQKETSDLEEQIEEMMTEQDHIVFEAEEQLRLRN